MKCKKLHKVTGWIIRTILGNIMWVGEYAEQSRWFKRERKKRRSLLKQI